MKTVAVGLLTLLALSCVQEFENPPGLHAGHGHTAAVLDGQLMVFGGSIGLQDHSEFRYPDLVRDFAASADGKTWAPLMPLGRFYAVGLRSLTHDGSVYVHGGGFSTPLDAGLQFDNTIWSSGNGVTWTAGGVFTGPGRKDHGFAWFDGSYWILGGNLGKEDSAIPYGPGNVRLANDVWRSDDGITWSEVLPNSPSPDRWSPREGHAVVVFRDKLWVIGGRGRASGPDGSTPDYGTLGDVWNTEDGVNWTRVPQEGASEGWQARGRAFHQVVELSGSLYLIGGVEINAKERRVTVRRDIRRSGDGAAWRRVERLSKPRYGHAAVVRDGKIYIVNGRDDQGLVHEVIVYKP